MDLPRQIFITFRIQQHAELQTTKCFHDDADCAADIVFVIDNSGSIRDNDVAGGNNWQLIIDFVKSIVEAYTIGAHATRVAVIDFG